MSLKWPKNGPNNVPSYLISGLPFVTSSAADELDGSAGNVVKVEFPYVTSEIAVTTFSTSSGVIRMGFTENGVKGTETHSYITIPVVANRPVTTPPFSLRCKEIYLRADGSYTSGFSVYASLTGIDKSLLPILTGSVTDPSGQIEWSGVG